MGYAELVQRIVEEALDGDRAGSTRADRPAGGARAPGARRGRPARAARPAGRARAGAAAALAGRRAAAELAGSSLADAARARRSRLLAAFRVPQMVGHRDRRGDRRGRLRGEAGRDQGARPDGAAAGLQCRARPAVDGDAAGRSRRHAPAPARSSAGSREARVSRRLPDTLVVDIVERRPAAIWQHKQPARADRQRRRRARAGPARRDARSAAGDRPGRQPPCRRARPPGRRRAAAEADHGRRDLGRRPPLGHALPVRRDAALPEGEAAAKKALAHFAAMDQATQLLGRGYPRFDMRIPGKFIVRVSSEPGSSVPALAPDRAAAPAPARRARPAHVPRRSEHDDLMKRMPAPPTRKLVTALDIGSSKVSALIAEPGEDGELRILGTGQRESRGVKRGFIADMERTEATIREAVEQAERIAGDQYRECLRRLLGRRPGQHRRQRRGRDRRPPDREGGYRRIARRRPGFDRRRRADDPPRHAGALHARRARGREEAARPPRRQARRRHPRHRRRAVAGAQSRSVRPLRPSRRRGDRRLAGRGRQGLPQRGGARARRRAGRARRRRHQRLGLRRRDAGRPQVARRSAASTSPTISPPPSAPAGSRRSG